VEQVAQPAQGWYSKHLEAFSKSRFARVLGRNDEAHVTGCACGQTRSKRAPHGPERPAERQLPTHCRAIESLRRSLTAGHQHRRRQREVEPRAGLSHRRRREVGREPLHRIIELRVQQRCPHPLACLSHRCIGKTHHREGREAAPDIHLDRDLVAVDSDQGEGGNACEHADQARRPGLTFGVVMRPFCDKPRKVLSRSRYARHP